MHFEQHALNSPFSRLVESVFHYRDFVPDHSIERVVPTGHVFVIFELDSFVRHTFDNETLLPIADFERAWISGPHLNYLSISAHERSEMFVIQFKPYGARPFLNRELCDLADRVVTGDDVPDLGLLPMREQLLAAPSSADKFAVAETWLSERFQEELMPPDSILEVAQELEKQPAAKLNDVLTANNGSRKHVIDLFKKYVGLTPKQYQRILRFNDIFAQMQNDQFLSWSDIAYSCGYSDQSHFIREFRNFSGFSPESFLKAEYDTDTPNFFPLD